MDCVSKGEIKVALESGFPNSKIIFAGVGKTDDEINYAIDQDIYCFNMESIPELEVRKISFSEDKNENTLEMPKLNVKMFEYEEEENFLKALKELQKDLSH